ncbi:SART-1 family-domain-containing protein [Suillus subaureus]|uniref:SART-1 family-domain-containing protein n=1 Tax=Suillus subaureus TaxID=48587 RepID=A0A9P7EI43_9AGAM|nr:SART-1 family-domain-containing protein [Suillus subaureus]KAG1821687.1 SART-1 family-domain-containing protein [Suillus subaureus]
MSMEESISLEETNKIRISLGLKPLTDDSAPADDKEKQAEDNYAKQRERQAKERETKQIFDRIAKVRNRRELHASLKGATLGDPDGDTEDTLKWIKKAKKRDKELAKERQQELENLDRAFQGDDYTEKDLVGLKVSHDFEDLGEGDARILTLKDSRVLDNEEDELQNVEMAEEERTRKNNELKIKRRDYTGYDDDEFGDGKAGMKRSILAKYDEDIEGPRETDFRLGNSITSTTISGVQAKQELASVNKSLLSIDYAKNLETRDYLQEGDIGFKKPKTKKKRSSRRAPIDGDENIMEVDEKPVVPRPRELDANFVDDDELQAALARSRRAKLHKLKKLSPEEIARKVAEERNREQSSQADDPLQIGDAEDGDTNGLTFDDTSEFVRAISYNTTAVKTEPAEESVEPTPAKQISPSRDLLVAAGDETLDEIEAGEVVKEEEYEDMMEVIAEAEEKTAAVNDDTEVGTSGEKTFGSGMAATLSLLRQQGVLALPSADQVAREGIQLHRDRFLAEYRHRQTQRETDRLQSRSGNKDQATREYENRLREQQEARAQLELFKDYKPDVEIVYYDEYGRVLTPKESWKALSHKFHGKGSGKMKTEKRLKKIAEEKKQAAMASGDTPLSMNRAFQIRQEKTGQAHFVLSVGNRGAVPQASEFLDPQPLSKGKTEKAKSKKKDSGKAGAPLLESTGFMTLPAPHSQSHLNSQSPAPSGFSSVIPPSGSNSPPVMKPGFSRISSAADTPTQTGTPVPSDRTKVAFGFGAKRKAAEDFMDLPPSKRR